MKPLVIKPARKVRGTVTMPGDKSISHRVVILASLCRGRTEIRHFLFSDDCLATLKALKAMGVDIRVSRRDQRVVVNSRGILHAPRGPLDMNESGTSARILLGLLAAQNFSSRLIGAPSLNKRPMGRVIVPLRQMGAVIQGRQKNGNFYLPVSVRQAVLHGISWKQEAASAQVKSAILLAGLFASGTTRVHEILSTRDHTERMLKIFGANIRCSGRDVVVKKSRLVSPRLIVVPGDISSAAFFIVAALLVEGSRLVLKNVGVNPTRTGILRALQRMGGCIQVKMKAGRYEPAADLDVRFSRLRGVRIRAKEIPSMVDELPVLMVAASLAKGCTVMEGVGELRVKETDRLRSMCWNLKRAGVDIKTKVTAGREDIEILGSGRLKSGHFKSFGDHRTAMSMFVAALAACEASVLDDSECVQKSFPDFFRVFKHLIVR